MDLKLTGKRAIVTGASRGIGFAIARELVKEGAAVALAARNRSALEEAVASIKRECEGQAFAVTVDTGNDMSVKEMVETVVREFGGVDILINTAAMSGTPVTKLADVTAEAFWAEFNIKVMGYIRCAREVAPLMAAEGWGRIINIAGGSARVSGSIVASVRNVAIVALTKNIADEFGTAGINVVAVHPGITRSERTDELVAQRAAASGSSPAEVERQMASNIVIGRLLEADETATVVAFLASPMNTTITGDVVAAGGGAKRAIHY